MPQGNNAAEEVFILQSSSEYNNDNRVASGIIYDNSVSNLESVNVQGAIDEIVTNLNVTSEYNNGTILATIQLPGVEESKVIYLPNSNSITTDIITNEFSTDISYSPDTYVIYNDGTGNKLYKALITTGTGPFDPEEWQEVQVMSEIVSGGGASTLNHLTDVNIVSVIDGQALIYDSGSGKWVNGNINIGTITNPTFSGTLNLNRASDTPGNYSSTLGYQCSAEGNYSTAMGNSCYADNDYSLAIGKETVTGDDYQFVFGKWNDESVSNCLEIAGNGESESNRSNARTLDIYGNETLGGDLTINNNSTPIVISERILPEPPNINGTYTLQCTVNDGTVVYSWI